MCLRLSTAAPFTSQKYMRVQESSQFYCNLSNRMIFRPKQLNMEEHLVMICLDSDCSN